MVQITGYNTNFVAGQMALGFGSSDITVERDLGGEPVATVRQYCGESGRIRAIDHGQRRQRPAIDHLERGLLGNAATPGQASLLVPILNQATSLEGIPAGGVAVINTSGLPSNLAGWMLTISNQQTSFTANAAGQILANVPAGATHRTGHRATDSCLGLEHQCSAGGDADRSSAPVILAAPTQRAFRSAPPAR